jgi:hypothetical protein
MRAPRIGHQVVQPAVGKRVGAVEHGGGQGAVLGPVGAGFFVAAVDAAHGQHHHGSGVRRTSAPWLR